MKRETDKCSQEIQIKLTINGELWSRVNSFKDSDSDDRHYVVRTDQDGNTVVRFGDGRKGSRPEVGSKITATYRYGGGKAGKSRKKRHICFSWD